MRTYLLSMILCLPSFTVSAQECSTDPASVPPPQVTIFETKEIKNSKKPKRRVSGGVSGGCISDVSVYRESTKIETVALPKKQRQTVTPFSVTVPGLDKLIVRATNSAGIVAETSIPDTSTSEQTKKEEVLTEQREPEELSRPVWAEEERKGKRASGRRRPSAPPPTSRNRGPGN